MRADSLKPAFAARLVLSFKIGFDELYDHNWLRRVDAGWRLIFNVDADIWGTQRRAELDVAEVPLLIEQPLALENLFKIELAEATDGGVLRMVWGQYQWTVPFEVID